MAEEDSSEKSEKATPHKLREAHKKGMVAKSQDVSSLLIMAGGLVLLYAAGSSLFQRSLMLANSLMSKVARVSFEMDIVLQWSYAVFAEGISILAAYVLPIMVVAVAASLLQTGMVFSFHPLKPDVQRLNPAKGFKKIFSQRTLLELVKSLLKLALFGFVTYLTFIEFIPKFMGQLGRAPNSYAPIFLDMASVLIFRILIVLAIIALVDFLFVRWEYAKKLRMSKKELKDEFKRFEGDPQIKQKRKEISRELLEKSKALRNVSDADVIITNPTRYAVALKYDSETMIAPKTVSRGSGPLAKKIRELAVHYMVPIMERPALARKLYRTTKIGSYIGEEEYREVAAVLREIYLSKRMASKI